MSSFFFRGVVGSFKGLHKAMLGPSKGYVRLYSARIIGIFINSDPLLTEAGGQVDLDLDSRFQTYTFNSRKNNLYRIQMRSRGRPDQEAGSHHDHEQCYARVWNPRLYRFSAPLVPSC